MLRRCWQAVGQLAPAAWAASPCLCRRLKYNPAVSVDISLRIGAIFSQAGLLAAMHRRLHAATHGLGTGKPLMLLLHGFPETWASWRHQIRVG